MRPDTTTNLIRAPIWGVNKGANMRPYIWVRRNTNVGAHYCALLLRNNVIQEQS